LPPAFRPPIPWLRTLKQKSFRRPLATHTGKVRLTNRFPPPPEPLPTTCAAPRRASTCPRHRPHRSLALRLAGSEHNLLAASRSAHGSNSVARFRESTEIS